MDFKQLTIENKKGIRDMSEMETSIVREHFDPIIGKAQNDYMIKLFQTEESITKQLEEGYRYFFVQVENRNVGFVAFYPRKDAMYISKFYLYKSERGKGYARQMMEYVISNAKKSDLNAVELNVNKNNNACLAYERLGFKVLRCEKNDIGNGFYMDDYVYRLELKYK